METPGFLLKLLQCFLCIAETGGDAWFYVKNAISKNIFLWLNVYGNKSDNYFRIVAIDGDAWYFFCKNCVLLLNVEMKISFL